MSSTVSSLVLFGRGILELCFAFFEKSLVEVISRDVVGTVFRVGVIPGSQRRERSSLDAYILECFRRLLGLSCMVVVSNFDRELGLEKESLVLLSSSNSASLGHFNVVGDGSKQADWP